MKPKRDTLTRLALAAAVASIVLTAIAFWLSFAHLEDIAHHNGLHDARSWAWPAAVDLFIVIGETLMLRASLTGARDWWAIGLTVFGSATSIGFNIAGVGPDAARMEYAVAAVPPTAALIAFGAVMRQLHTAIAARVETETTVPAARETPVETTAPQPAETTVSRPPETTETTGETEVPALPETARETASETRETTVHETAPARSPRPRKTETPKVTAIGDRETETAMLLGLIRSRGNAHKVTLDDAIRETGRPKSTAAKRLAAARDQYLAETA